MAFTRGDVTDIEWIFARLEMKCLITSIRYRVVKYGSVISQLSVLGSHITIRDRS